MPDSSGTATDASGTAVPEQAVVVLIRDLFFSVKVRNELSEAGYRPVLVKREPELLSVVEAEDPVLVLIDLNARPDWDRLKPLLEDDDASRGTPVLAFGPHKDVDARRAAQAAGVARVVTNQQLHKRLREYVERYARPQREE
jgi:DNA-binding NtrC family response regulator